MVVLVVVAALLRLADRWYYRDPAPVLRALRLAPREDGPAGLHRRLDPAFAVVPFAWGWCDLAAAALLAARLGNPFAYAALAVFAATRFRHQQEVSHTAVHGGLARSRRWQWALSDLLANAPLFRPDMPHRYEAHVRQHHWNVNDPALDPNVVRFVAVGFVPGLTRAAYRRKLLHPFALRGLRETLGMTARNATRNTSRWVVVARLTTVPLVAGSLLWAGGPALLAAGYVVPLLTVYPFFSWISLLAEHRWFVDSDAADRWTRECTAGRPTAYPGVVSWVASRAICPASDRHHLAHSLYPSVRWNHLPAIDAVLRRDDPRYARYGSVGLVVARSGRPSALSDLRDRVTLRTDDLAPWALPADRHTPEPQPQPVS